MVSLEDCIEITRVFSRHIEEKVREIEAIKGRSIMKNSINSSIGYSSDVVKEYLEKLEISLLNLKNYYEENNNVSDEVRKLLREFSSAYYGTIGNIYTSIRNGENVSRFVEVIRELSIYVTSLTAAIYGIGETTPKNMKEGYIRGWISEIAKRLSSLIPSNLSTNYNELRMNQL